jgi:hypothetical protein
MAEKKGTREKKAKGYSLNGGKDKRKKQRKVKLKQISALKKMGPFRAPFFTSEFLPF